MPSVPFDPVDTPTGLRLTTPLLYTTPSFAFSAYNPSDLIQVELSIWNNAVANPQQALTMVCVESYNPTTDAQKCNPLFDGRRKALESFVDTQYRQANGAWLQSVQPGFGVQWRVNVAHSSTGRFTLLHADADRDSYASEPRVWARRLLSDAVCENDGSIANRICVKVSAACPRSGP